MDEMKIYLTAPGELVEKAARYGPVAARLWRLGRDLKLNRAPLPGARPALAVVDAISFRGHGPHEALARTLLCQCRLAGCRGLVLELPRPNEALLRFCQVLDRMAAGAGLELTLPRGYAAAAPGSLVLIPAQNTGGTYEQRLRRLAALYGADRLALDLDTLASRYLLPCRAGLCRKVNVSELPPLIPHFSPALCANTASRLAGGRAEVILWDDGSTLRQKVTIASTIGIRRGFIKFPPDPGEGL